MSPICSGLLQMLDAAIGMLYLHSRATPVIHRDLKSPNLLVDENWRIKVRRLGLACMLTAGGWQPKARVHACCNAECRLPACLRVCAGHRLQPFPVPARHGGLTQLEHGSHEPGEWQGCQLAALMGPLSWSVHAMRRLPLVSWYQSHFCTLNSWAMLAFLQRWLAPEVMQGDRASPAAGKGVFCCRSSGGKSSSDASSGSSSGGMRSRASGEARCSHHRCFLCLQTCLPLASSCGRC